jgi:formylglycine-generating enzyme required for sulfatase activity
MIENKTFVADDQLHGPNKVKRHAANKFGLYDVFGNVSEMVADTSIAKGGSWVSNADNFASDEPLRVSPHIGFRPVISIGKP